MYTSMIKKLLFPKETYQSYPNLIVTLLDKDTELVSLGGLCKEESVHKTHVAAVITWIVANRPEELEAFITAYGSPGKVYEALKDWNLPANISAHFGIHEKVSAIINPAAKLCKDDRVGSFGISRHMLAKCPVSTLPGLCDSGWRDAEYRFTDRDATREAVKGYVGNRHFNAFFIGSLTEEYKNAVSFNKTHKGKDAVELKGLPMAKAQVSAKEDADPKYALAVIYEGGNKYSVRFAASTSGYYKNGNWMPPSTAHNGERICFFTADKVAYAANYRSITAVLTKLPPVPSVETPAAVPQTPGNLPEAELKGR